MWPGMHFSCVFFFLSVAGLILYIKHRVESRRNQKSFETTLLEARRIGLMGSFRRDLRTNDGWWSDETYSLFGLDKSTAIAGL
jgi:hypothetical protein